jgi:phosphatidylinositol 4-kinase
MDYHGIARGSIRAEAFKKLARSALGAESRGPEPGRTASPGHGNLERLLGAAPATKLSAVAMSLREFEVLVALCEATAATIATAADAAALVARLRLYLLELSEQRFAPEVEARCGAPVAGVLAAPWLALAQHLAGALANILLQYDELVAPVVAIFEEFLAGIFGGATAGAAGDTFVDASEAPAGPALGALLGFVRALTAALAFLARSPAAFALFGTLDAHIDSPRFLAAVEVLAAEVGDPEGEYSPILFLESLSRLMCAVAAAVVGAPDTALMEFVLERVSRDEASALPEASAEASPAPPSGALGAIAPHHMHILAALASVALAKMDLLDRGEPYIVYSTLARLKTGYLAKAYNLQVIGCGMFTDNVTPGVAGAIFRSCLQIYDVMLDEHLGPAVVQLGALLVFKDERIGLLLTKVFTSLVANGALTRAHCAQALRAVGQAAAVLSQDAVVTTIYTLTNLLGSDVQVRAAIRRTTGGALREPREPREAWARADSTPALRVASASGPGSLTSGGGAAADGAYTADHLNVGAAAGSAAASAAADDASPPDTPSHLNVCTNAIIAISEITEACRDETVTTLAVTILLQKLSKTQSPISLTLLQGLVLCAPILPEREFVILMRLLDRLTLEVLETKNWPFYHGVVDARVALLRRLKQRGPLALYWVYLRGMLELIISKGDVQVLEHHRSHVEISEIGEQIGVYLRPLAHLLPDVERGEPRLAITDTTVLNLFRNIWFNMVVHGYLTASKFAARFDADLRRIVYSTPPLLLEQSWDRTETLLELNTVLRRGLSNHNVKDHKHAIGGIFDVPRVSYPKLMFLSTTVFVELLRVKACGDCLTALMYLLDPSLRTSGVDKYIGHIAFKVVQDYIALVGRGADKRFMLLSIAAQLTNMLALCCHRMEDLQDAALQCCDLLITRVPLSLCNRTSLFTLLDLLTVLFRSLLDADRNQYDPSTLYRTKTLGLALLLPDLYKWRHDTFARVHAKARAWLGLILQRANDDVKLLAQSYVAGTATFDRNVEFGVSFALEMAGQVTPMDRELCNASQIAPLQFNTLPAFLLQLRWQLSFASDLSTKVETYTRDYVEGAFDNVRARADSVLARLQRRRPATAELVDLLRDCAGLTLILDANHAEMVRLLVAIPFVAFDADSMTAAIAIWYLAIKDRQPLSRLILLEIFKHWETSIETHQGVFLCARDLTAPEYLTMEYAPLDTRGVAHSLQAMARKFEPHLLLIRLIASNFELTLNQSDHLLKLFTRFVEVGMYHLPRALLHPLARVVRFELVRFALNVLAYHVRIGLRGVEHLTRLVLQGALSWFRARFSYPVGLDLLKIKADYQVLREVAAMAAAVDTSAELAPQKAILMLFLDDEIAKIAVWLLPLAPPDHRGTYALHLTDAHVAAAYRLDPMLAINLALRYKIKNVDETLQRLITADPLPAARYPDAVQYFIGINAGATTPLYHLLLWEPLAPVDAITLFLPPFGGNPFVLQYAMRSLESHDVNLTFFYVPQIVQLLRFDARGYVERFILETAKVSQLFAHQIVWNMLANSYKDEDLTEPDALKPVLDRIQRQMVALFSPKDLQFYQKEFGFFNTVTSILGKLKPYIKKTKAEKKVKIDEEMAQVEIQLDVYLPSNPDGVVIDINRKLGKPLQSHAKAPFMATFKIRKQVEVVSDDGDTEHRLIEKWQSAIFKVGDDCRQDVLALQLIAVFRTIWSHAGLDLYVYPYRVTATAPGCGVIDVLPNSTSRDMLGREAVNGLYEYFTTKFGPELSIEFQQARNNLIKLLAAYSIISYLLQFKDRHNGNIMYDDQGHVLHIDFGFCFDIVPGGVKFEMAPFKLTHEMVLVLGGSHTTQAFQWFEELCVKGYLACRPYMETIVRCVNPMLESGLPCFKEATIRKLRARFVPARSEKEASLYMKGLVRKSMESMSTKGYDEFQRLTNGIPY